MYACLARRDAAAGERAHGKADAVVPASRAWAGKYAADLLEIIDWCLRLDHLQASAERVRAAESPAG